MAHQFWSARHQARGGTGVGVVKQRDFHKALRFWTFVAASNLSRGTDDSDAFVGYVRIVRGYRTGLNGPGKTWKCTRSQDRIPKDMKYADACFER